MKLSRQQLEIIADTITAQRRAVLQVKINEANILWEKRRKEAYEKEAELCQDAKLLASQLPKIDKQIQKAYAAKAKVHQAIKALHPDWSEHDSARRVVVDISKHPSAEAAWVAADKLNSDMNRIRGDVHMLLVKLCLLDNLQAIEFLQQQGVEL
jgi:predicted ribosome quality control (RQC) complex YloA/Tae2 family protein